MGMRGGSQQATGKFGMGYGCTGHSTHFSTWQTTEEKFQSSLLYMGSTNQGGKAVSDCVSVDVDARFLQSCEGHAACSGTYNQRPTTSLTDVRFSYDRWT